MKTILVRIFVASMISCFAPPVLLLAAPHKPNVIFILADDLGIGNVGCYGSDNYKTPNIDKLATSGTRFSQSFTAALCGPSRALIMTGRYAFRNGSTNQDACMVMPNSELQLARTFKSAGYMASFIGKWGQLPGEPDEAGFDDYLRFNGSGVYVNQKPDKPEQYRVNRQELKLGNKEYMPDLMHEQAVRFIKKHQFSPFFLYYSLVHVHGDILPTPDSPPDSQDLFGDNILYMDKLVGKLVSELDALKLREKTLIIFMGDNGTGKGQNPRSTISGRNLSGMKGSMLECGGLVPMIANWPGTTPAGQISANLIDSTDLITTFAELADAKLPGNTVFDGQSFAPQLRGANGKPREWIFNQLARMWYVRDAQFKLNQAGELYDLSGAPFTETLIELGKESPAAISARKKLAAVLEELDPAGGILDAGDGSGRHANKAEKKKENGSSKKDMKPTEQPTEELTAESEAAERAVKFDKLDHNKAGKITREYYATHQSDAATAAERFEKYDTDRDGLLSRDEFIHRGKTAFEWVPFPATSKIAVLGLPWHEQNSPKHWRMPATKMDSLPNGVQNRAKCPSGARILLRCTTTRLAIRFKGDNKMNVADFETFVDGQTCETSGLNNTNESKEFVLFQDLVPQEKEIVIYLPHVREVEVTAIGVDPGTKFSDPNLSFAQALPIVFYGSSVCQGSGAEHSGQTYGAILGRNLNLDFVNLGFGGSGKAESNVVELVNSIDACCFVFDLGKSYGPQDATAFKAMIQSVRKNHPNTPIVAITPITSAKELLDPSYSERSIHTRTVMRDTVNQLIEAGEKQLFLVQGESLLGFQDHAHLSRDGIHPSDQGYALIATRLLPVLKQAIGENQIIGQGKTSL